MISFLLLFLFISNCEKQVIVDNSKIPEQPEIPDTEKPEPPVDSASRELTHLDSVAIAKLPAYYKFLTSLKDSGYAFLDFRTYFKTDSILLPQKLLVIRHDIHYRDIKWAYYAFQIEKIVIGSGRSTFYIMLNDPDELSHSGSAVQDLYMDLIRYLDSNKVDIQPHISPIDMYINFKQPEWVNLSLDSLRKIFNLNYRWEKDRNGRELQVTGEDILNLNDMNAELMTLLPEYNQLWKNHTNLDVQGYASHGSATLMNLVVNNAEILDQNILLNSGIYHYDTYNSKIFKVLTYLSDNSLPGWMRDPQFISPGRYQFLMHPYQWIYVK